MCTEKRNSEWNFNPFTNKDLNVYAKIGICGGIIMIAIAVMYMILQQID